jgi:hypothetical protein
MEIRNRIREMRLVRAGELLPNPRNWRLHPKLQREAMQGLLEELGYTDALIARQLPEGGLMLLDGHLRAEITPDTVVPVLIVDVTAEEADKILLTLDPIGAMASDSSLPFDAGGEDPSAAPAVASIGVWSGVIVSKGFWCGWFFF